MHVKMCQGGRKKDAGYTFHTGGLAAENVPSSRQALIHSTAHWNVFDDHRQKWHWVPAGKRELETS